MILPLHQVNYTKVWHHFLQLAVPVKSSCCFLTLLSTISHDLKISSFLATLCVDISLCPYLLSFLPSVGNVLESREENVNNKEWYCMLTNKSFPPSLRENEDNSNPIKTSWGKKETQLLLPTALLFLCFGLHCNSPAMSLPGKPAYELPSLHVLCFTFLVIYMHSCYQVMHSKGNMMF